jgi:hypothetical protein
VRDQVSHPYSTTGKITVLCEFQLVINMTIMRTSECGAILEPFNWRCAYVVWWQIF